MAGIPYLGDDVNLAQVLDDPLLESFLDAFPDFVLVFVDLCVRRRGKEKV